MTLQEAARLLGVGRTLVSKLIERGVLPAKQVVQYAPWVIERSDLIAAGSSSGARSAGRKENSVAGERPRRIIATVKGIEQVVYYVNAYRRVWIEAVFLTPLASRARRKARCRVERHMGSSAVGAPRPLCPLAGKRSFGWRWVRQSWRSRSKVRLGSGTKRSRLPLPPRM